MTAYAQLLSVGLVWISFHCAGMCGPILMGLDVAGVARGHGALKGAGSVLLYQLGRASTYAVLGALAGLVGRGLGEVFRSAGGVVAIAFGLVMIGYGLLKRLRPKAAPDRPVTRLEQRGRREPLLQRFQASLHGIVRRLALRDDAGAARVVLLGAVLGLLPCMITLWALGLAATTGSPLHGAGVMVLLVAMTTPVLLGVTLLPRALIRLVPGRWLGAVPSVLAVLSGAWLVMVGLAGLGVVPHEHVHVGDYMLMLW
jgi:sulfite exporter TauE/SafE